MITTITKDKDGYVYTVFLDPEEGRIRHVSDYVKELVRRSKPRAGFYDHKTGFLFLWSGRRWKRIDTNAEAKRELLKSLP